MTTAADLRERFRFERRAVDGNGDRLGAWGADAFERSAAPKWLNGGEGVLQQRLAGTQPVILTVRYDSKTRAVDGTWRAVDVRNSPEVRYEIRSKHPAPDPRFIEILAVEVRGDAD
jgi:hypothetical protein